MGEAFISMKKEQFEHRRDAAVEKHFKEENLLSRLPDVSFTVYRCALTSADRVPNVGDTIALAELTAGEISVLDRNVVIGYVQSADAQKLLPALRQSGVSMLVGNVHSVGKLSRSFTITISVAQT